MNIRLFLIAVTLIIINPVVCSADNVHYKKEDSIKVVKLLREARQLPEDTNLMIHFGRKLIGIPYVAYTLEVNDRERLVVNLRQLDCTTFVENVLCLSLCVQNKIDDFQGFCNMLRSIRYKEGSAPSYTNRLHYFTSWIEDNSMMGYCKEIQSPTPPFTAVQTLNIDFMTTHTASYRMLKGNNKAIGIIRETEKELTGKRYRYIPKTSVGNNEMMRKAVKDGDILALTTNIKGLDVQHIGIAVWHADGLHLLNASSIRKMVVEEPQTLYRYLSGRKTMTGVRVIRPL